VLPESGFENWLQAMHPSAGLATVDIEQHPSHIEGRIALEVEQDVKQLVLRAM
jgi:hypothetical protein